MIWKLDEEPRECQHWVLVPVEYEREWCLLNRALKTVHFAQIPRLNQFERQRIGGVKEKRFQNKLKNFGVIQGKKKMSKDKKAGAALDRRSVRGICEDQRLGPEHKECQSLWGLQISSLAQQCITICQRFSLCPTISRSIFLNTLT